MMMEEWITYSDAGDHAVCDDTRYGYAQWNTREVMKGLLDGHRMAYAVA